MTSTQAKELVHHLTNQLQVVLSSLELGEWEKAMVGVKQALSSLRQLRQAIQALTRRGALPDN